MKTLNEYRRIISELIQHYAQLVAAGIPREHIVLAFKPPEARPLTDYAVA